MDKAQVVACLRACIVSAQGGIPASDLNRDYRELIGTDIPYRTYKFSCLEDFLKSIDGIVITRDYAGNTMVEAKANEKTGHISKLVENQKRATKKSSSRRIASKRPPPSRGPRFVRYSNPINNCPPPPNEGRGYPAKPSFPRKQPSQGGFPSSVPPPPRCSPPKQNPKGNPAPPPPSAPKKCFKEHERDINHNSQPLVDNPFNPPAKSLPSKPISGRGLLKTPPLSCPPPSKTPAKQTPHLNTKKKTTTSVQNRLLNVGLKASNSIPVENESVPSAENKLKPINEPRLSPGESAVEKLAKLLNARNWPPAEILLLPRRPKNEPIQYHCKVTIFYVDRESQQVSRTIDYSTFPCEYTDMEEAKEAGAWIAYKAILTWDQAPMILTTDKDLIIKRIWQMVKDKPQGVWDFQVAKIYQDIHKESLPSIWISVIEQSGLFQIDKLAGVIIRPAHNKTEAPSEHVEPSSHREPSCPPPQQPQSTQPPTPQMIQSQLQSILPIKHYQLSDLDLPQQDTWEVYVTKVDSTDKVWFRLIGPEYSGLYDQLLSDMEKFYSNPSHTTPPYLIVPRYYAVTMGTSSTRVQLVGFEGDYAKVFFIDHGEVDALEKSCLLDLDPRFFSLPKQASTFSLQGLEKCSHLQVTNVFSEMLEGRSFVAKVVGSDPLSVVLLDTSDDNEIININEHIKNLLDSERSIPRLHEAGVVEQVVVSAVDRGEVYISMLNNCLSEIEDALKCTDLVVLSKYKLKDNLAVYKDRLYLYDSPERRHRVQPLPPIDFSADYVTVHCVDSGEEFQVKTTSLYETYECSETIRFKPYQALKVTLDKLPSKLSPDLSKALTDISPIGSPCLAKVIAVDQGVPRIVLFRRLETRALISINHSLSLVCDPQIQDIVESTPPAASMKPQIKGGDLPENQFEQLASQVEGVVLEKSKPPILRSLSDSSKATFDTSNLRWADFPEIRSLTELFIVDVSNPSHFTFQLMSNLAHLNDMIGLMFNYFNTHKETLSSDTEVPALCAAKMPDGYWGRALLCSQIGAQTTVQFLDFGTVGFIGPEHIRPLPSFFLNLPFQGFKGKIGGVKPQYADWSIEDSIWFTDNIKGKKLWALIIGKEEEPEIPSKTRVVLDLIDTSGVTDVYISKLLVTQGRAAFLV